MFEWRNWSGSVSARPSDRIAIDDEAELQRLIRSTDRPLKVVGSGHSFTPLLQTDDVHVALDGLNEVSVAGPGLIAAGAGVILREMTSQMHELGHALANMGDVDGQRLGGALATATHGTGADFTTYAAMLRELTIVDGRGDIRVLSDDADRDMFRAMAVSIGTGGIATRAVLATVPPYRLARRRFALPIRDLLGNFDALMRAARNVEFFYITHSGAALGLQSEATDGPLVRRPPDKDQEGLRQLRFAGQMMGRFPVPRRWLLSRLLLRHAVEEFTEDWHLAYPTERDGLRFNETEWHIPAESGPAALREVIATVERYFPEVYFPMEIRMTAADELSLSPFYRQNCVSIAVHHEAGRPFAPLLAAVEPIFLRHGGRPHWGKMHSLTARELRPLYPLWDEAVAVRRELDPDGRFLTPYLRRLLGL